MTIIIALIPHRMAAITTVISAIIHGAKTGSVDLGMSTVWIKIQYIIIHIR